MLQGPSTALYQEIIENSTIELIASGGISNIEDVKNEKKLVVLEPSLVKRFMKENFS